MNLKSLLLIGVVSLAVATIVKTVLDRLEDDEHLHEYDEEDGFPMFI